MHLIFVIFLHGFMFHTSGSPPEVNYDFRLTHQSFAAHKDLLDFRYGNFCCCSMKNSQIFFLMILTEDLFYFLNQIICLYFSYFYTHLSDVIYLKLSLICRYGFSSVFIFNSIDLILNKLFMDLFFTNFYISISLQSLSGHTSPVEAVRFGSAEEMVVAGSLSGALKIWDLEAAKSKWMNY